MKHQVNQEWLISFNELFGNNASFERVSAFLLTEVVTFQREQAIRYLEHIKQLHAKEFGQYRDFFGDWIMSQKIKLDANFDQVLTPYPIVDFMSLSACHELQEQFKGQTIQFIDPFCGTGRFMLGIAAACITSGIRDKKIYCVDIDQRMVAYCITNALLHKVDCHIILGDVLDFRIDRAWCVQGGKISELLDFEHLYDVIGREPKEVLKQRDLI